MVTIQAQVYPFLSRGTIDDNGKYGCEAEAHICIPDGRELMFDVSVAGYDTPEEAKAAAKVWMGANSAKQFIQFSGW